MEPRRFSSARSIWLAFAWGFAEATVFFIVPDVFLTRLALRNLRRALMACVGALAGALLGGAGLWFVAHQGETGRLFHGFVYLPGIDSELIARTGQAMHERGVGVLFSGGLLGQPYKLFAVHAGAQEVPLPTFLLVSAAARLSRFVITTLLAWAIGRALRRSPEIRLERWHACVWLVVYLFYFFAWH